MSKEVVCAQWWKASDEDLPSQITQITNKLTTDQEYVYEDNLRNARLYGNVELFGLSATQYSQRVDYGVRSSSRLTYNIVKSCVDTACNRIAKSKPLPMFLTEMGNQSQQSKGKKLTQLAEGIFYQTKIFEVGQQVFRDGCLFDSGGFMKIYRSGQQIIAERTLPMELLFDDVEAYYGTYNTLYQRKVYTRDALYEMFPGKKNLIMNATPIEVRVGIQDSLQDMIPVKESWKKAVMDPKGKIQSMGTHAITLDNAILIREDWDKCYFPFAQFMWTPPLFGARGMSLSTELTGIQIEINRILKTIHQILRLTVPKLFVEKGSKVVFSHLNNEIGGIVEFDESKPGYDFLQAIPPDLYNQLDRLVQKAYEMTGISQLSASSMKPAGLDSGRALRTYNDIEAQRFTLKAQAYEAMYMQATPIMMDLCKEIKEEFPKYSVKTIKKGGIESIDWKDVKMDDDEYVMKIFPISSLSQTPSGRLEDVKDIAEAGWINETEALKLLDYPDLEATLSLKNAPADDIMAVIEDIEEKSIYSGPEEYQDLEYGRKYMTYAYLRGKRNKLEEEKLDMFRRWIDEATDLLAMAAPKPAAAEAPLGVPNQPPVSDLMPIQ